MRMRFAVPSLLALSLITAVPAAHAGGCGVTVDTGDQVALPKTFDVVKGQVTTTRTTITFTMTIGSTDAATAPETKGGISYYIAFKLKQVDYKVWRHVLPAFAPGPDVYGGMYAKNGFKPVVKVTPTTFSLTLPRKAYPTLRVPTDACSMKATAQLFNAYNVDETA